MIEDPTQANRHNGAALYDGGTLEDSSVTLGNSADSRAVYFGSTDSELRAQGRQGGRVRALDAELQEDEDILGLQEDHYL